MHRVATYALVGIVLTGCSTARAAYDRPGGTEGERRRDFSDCTQLALGHDGGRHVFLPFVVDREIVAKCLEARGYSKTR